MQSWILMLFPLLLILTTPPIDSCKTIDERNKATQMVVNHDDSSNLVNFHGPTAKIMSWLLIALIVLYAMNELKKIMKRRKRSGRGAPGVLPATHPATSHSSLPPIHPPTSLPLAVTLPTAPQQVCPPTYNMISHDHQGSQIATLPYVTPTHVNAPPLISKLPNLSQKEE